MRMHLRTCAAVLPLALVSIAPAQAQTAVETVAFITLGIEPSRAGENYMGKRVFTTNGDDTVTWHETFPSGVLIRDLTITEEEPCKYRISGQDFTATPYEHNIDRDITIDLTAMTPTQSFREYIQFPGDKTRGTWKAYYYSVGGAKVCTIGQSKDGTMERFPAQGECRQELQTDNFHDAASRDRMLAALNHLRANFCKPRAF